MTSIVIPSYNHWELTHALLFNIYINMQDVDEIILMDDCSTDEKINIFFKFLSDIEFIDTRVKLERIKRTECNFVLAWIIKRANLDNYTNFW